MKTRIGELIDVFKDGFDFPATWATGMVRWTETGALIHRVEKINGRGNEFEMIVGLERSPLNAKQ